MNRTAIKNFAIWARRYLREQVTARATQYGITRNSIIEPQKVTGGLLVAGQTLDANEATQYDQLLKHLHDLRINHRHPQAVDALIDEIAYTWFNRLAALRFMEVNGYIGRVLSSSDPNLVDPDILRDAFSIAEMGELAGFDLETLNQWRSFASREPNPDEFIYRRLLLAQCNALAEGIPALFDKSKNYQALFLPGNLLNQDSILRRLVKEIPESDWQDIEVVGWLYQFYISERKDEVIGAKSKVAAADIPAATQLFTPRWIVQYMVENSLGRLWLESHPESNLREKMPYYLENQEPLPNPLPRGEGIREEEDNLESLIQNPKLVLSEVEVSKIQNPQELTVIDPACGSGHILVYAFDLLFEIYKEQGYLERDIPALILTHNLHGLDIDERAAQLASFAVLMKARAKNSRILRKPVVLNITTVRPVYVIDLGFIPKLNAEDWEPLIEAFKDADNLGSLITLPIFDAENLKQQLDDLEEISSVFREYIPALRGLVLQAELLNKQYWVVVANPPYMDSSLFSNKLKIFVNNNYKNSKSNLFAIFMEFCIRITFAHGCMAMINQHSWMFISSYENFRKQLLLNYTIESMIHLGTRAFPEISGEVVQSTTFVIHKFKQRDHCGIYIRLTDYNNSALKEQIYKTGKHRYINVDQSNFLKIPGNTIAYWASKIYFYIFSDNLKLSNYFFSDGLTKTGNNEKYLRFSWEPSIIKAKNDEIYRICAKGGEAKKYYGNKDILLNWTQSARLHYKNDHVARITPSYLWNQEGITWTKITSKGSTFRLLENGIIAETGGPAIFSNEQSEIIIYVLAFLCSKVYKILVEFVNPTLNVQTNDVLNLPLIIKNENKIIENTNQIISIAKNDWNYSETSWDFLYFAWLIEPLKSVTVKQSWNSWENHCIQHFQKIQTLETENNRLFIEAYSLQDELTPEVADDQITIRRADLNKDIRSLISYAVGCIMGRYSLDKPGLIHAGQPFDPNLHQTFPADINAIIPITDQAYFDDDIVTRFVDFIRIAYSPETLTENLEFIANALTLKNGESPRERIRRYFLQEFICDHIQIYKKRPIYWLFTSGKKRAFGALIYLHRYSEDTLARIRTDYVLELQVKLDGEIARAQQQLENASSSIIKKAAIKRLKELQDQQLELRDYQAKLQHLADARINLDLDDGVAYNYTRFKGLVYEGADLKMADLEKASQWKRDLLKQNS